MAIAAAPLHSFPPYALPAPVVAGPVAQVRAHAANDAFRSALVRFRHGDICATQLTRHSQITFSGTLCLGIIAAGYASPDTLKTSRALAISVACGMLGCLFTLASLFLDRQHGGQCFFLLSLLAAAIGAVIMVAAIQAWEVGMIVGICIVVTVGVVWWLKAFQR